MPEKARVEESHRELTLFDVIGLAIASAMIVLLLGRVARNLRALAANEPAAPRR